MAEMKKDNVTVNNGNIDEKEQQGTPDSPANDKTDKTEKIGVGKKIGSFFKKNGKRIGVGLGIVAAFAGGIAADKIGIPKFGKGDPDQPAEE